MRWVAVWSLKRGIVDPPEPVDNVTQRILQAEYFRAMLDRDPPLTMEQWWAEEGRRGGYEKKRRIA